MASACLAMLKTIPAKVFFLLVTIFLQKGSLYATGSKTTSAYKQHQLKVLHT